MLEVKKASGQNIPVPSRNRKEINYFEANQTDCILDENFKK